MIGSPPILIFDKKGEVRNLAGEKVLFKIYF